MADKLYALAETKGINTEDRTIEAWASRAVLDRDGEIILADAWDTANFELNPVLIAAHNYAAYPPLGKVTELKKTKDGLRFKAVFASTSAGNEALQYVSEMGIAAFSVGFIPRAWKDYGKAEVRAMGFDVSTAASERIRIYSSAELIEISLVSVPSCPKATVIGRAFLGGKIHDPELAVALKSWAGEINKDQLTDNVRRLLAGMDFPGMVQTSIEEHRRSAANDRYREVIKAALIAKLKAERDKVREAKAARDRDEKLKQLDLNDPAQLEKAVDIQLSGIDIERIIRDQTKLELDRAMGKVY